MGENRDPKTDQLDLILLPDEMSDGGSQMIFRDRMDEGREVALVIGTSGAAISSAKQRNNRKGKTSDPCDYNPSSSGPLFLPPLDESAGYTGGITNEPAERSTGMCVVTTTVSTHC